MLTRPLLPTWLPWRLRMRVWWSVTMMNLSAIEMATRGIWIWVGHLGVGFRRIPRFSSKLMVKRGARKGVRVSRFGPLVLTWEETAN